MASEGTVVVTAVTTPPESPVNNETNKNSPGKGLFSLVASEGAVTNPPGWFLPNPTFHNDTNKNDPQKEVIFIGGE